MLKKLHFKSLLLIAVMLLGGASTVFAEETKTETFNFTTSGCTGWSATNGGSYCGLYGNKTNGLIVTNSSINNFSDVDFEAVSSASLEISVTGLTNSGTNQYVVSLVDKDGNEIGTPVTKTGGLGVGSNSNSAKESTVEVTPVKGATGYKIKFQAKGSIKQTKYTLKYTVITGPVISADNVNIAYDATSGEIPYEVINPTGATLNAAKTTGDWISSNNVVVDAANNRVTFAATKNTGAEREGTITLSYTGADDKVVTVTQAAAPILVTEVVLDKTSASIEVGETVTLTPTIKPDEASNKAVLWSSGNTDVATVDNGVVTAVAVGEATITVETVDGGHKANCIVTVNPVTQKLNIDIDFSKNPFGLVSNAQGETLDYSYQGVNIHLEKETAGTNPRIDKELYCRVYANSSLKVSAPTGYVLTGITFDFSEGSLKIDDTIYNSSQKTWTGFSESVTFIGNVKCFIKKMSITLSPKSVEIPVSSATGFATFCSPFALDFTGVSTIEAYTAAIKGSNVEFTKVEGSVPANTGLLVKAAAAGTYEVPAVASFTANVDNVLVGTVAGTTINGEDASNDYYVLKQNDKGGVGFYRVTNKADKPYQVRPKSAYLAVPKGTLAKGFIPVDGTTAIELVDTANEVAAPVYNLQGQRVGNDYKGVVIVNGKKVIR